MSQHDFNIANQSFPATRTDLNNALVALASNSSGDAEPATKYANQWWYETDTNTLKLRNEANDAWISIAVLDQSGNAVQSITTAGLTLGATAISATGAEINTLDGLSRGSLIYGNASAATAVLTKGGAGTVLTSDGTDISWVSAAGGGAGSVVFPADWASPTNTYTSSGTWSKGSLSDDDYVWIYLIGSGGGGGSLYGSGIANGGNGGSPLFLYGQAKTFNGGAYAVAAAKAGNSAGSYPGTSANHTTFTLSSANGSTVFTTDISGDTTSSRFFTVFPQVLDAVSLASFADFTLKSKENETMLYEDAGLPSGVAFRYLAPGKEYNDTVAAEHCIFGGGNGAGFQSNAKLSGTSEFCGAGGASAAQGADGIAPGGGGGASQSGSNAGGSGAQGAVRTYHV